MKQIPIVLLVSALAVTGIEAQTTDPATPAAASSAIRIAVTPGIEASASGSVKDDWMAAVLEAYFPARLAPFTVCGTVGADQMHQRMPDLDEYGKPFLDKKAIETARALGATHLIIQKYEIGTAGTTVSYYLEVWPAAGNAILMSFEKEISLDRLDEGLGEFLTAFFAKVKLTPPADAAKTLKMPLLGADPKALQALGGAIIHSRKANRGSPAKAAQDFLKAGEKNPGMALAYLLAADAFTAAGDPGQAAAADEHVIVQNGIAYPALFVAAAKGYRAAKQLDAALHIISLADRLGIKDGELLAENARVLEEQGNTAAAGSLFAKIFAADPNQPDAILFMARQSNAKADFQKALELSERLTSGPLAGPADMEKGRALAGLNRTDEAIKAFQLAVKIMPDDADLQKALGDAFRAKKMFPQAAAAYEKALKGYPNDEGILLKASECYADANNAPTALAILTANLSHFYSSKVVPKEMGLLEFQLKDTANARKHLESYLNSEPKDGRVFLDLGRIYTAAGEYTKAIQMLDAAMPLVEDKNSCRAALAKLYVATKEYAKAEPLLNAVLAAEPEHPQVNRLLGDVMRNQGKTAAALVLYKKERSLTGDEAGLVLAIAQCEMETGDLATAFTDFKRLTALEPTNAGAMFNLAVISLKQKNIKSAQEYLAQAEVLGKSDKAIYRELGKAYASAGSYDKAAQAYTTSLSALPNDGSLWAELGGVYSKLKRDSLAAAAYERAFELDRVKNKGLGAEAGHLYFRMGNKPAALAAYNAYLDKGNSDPDVAMNAAVIEFANKNYAKVIVRLKTLPAAQAGEIRVVGMLATSCAATGDNAGAIKYADELLAKEPNNRDAIESLALTNEKSGNLKRAVVMYKKFLALPRTDRHPEYAYHTGELLEKSGQPDAAIAQYQANTTAYPGDLRNFTRLAELLKAGNQPTAASRVLAAAILLPGAPVSMFHDLADDYHAIGKEDLASTAYEQYLKKVPSDSSAWVTLAAIYYSQNNFRKALVPLRKVTELMPKNAEAFQRLGLAYIRCDSLRAAVAPLNAYTELNPSDPKTLEALTRCFRTLKDTTALISVLRRREPNDRDRASIDRELGDLLMNRGQVDQAILSYEAASAADPADVKLHLLLAGLYEKKNDKRNRLTHLDAALSRMPDDAGLNFQRARYCLDIGDQPSAEKYLRKTIELDPRTAAAHNQLGRILEARHDNKDALVSYNEAVKLAPSNIGYLIDLARVQDGAADAEGALKTAQRALALAPKNPEVMVAAGLYYKENNQADRAEPLLVKGFEADKSCTFCQEALGDIYNGKGDVAKAIASYDGATHQSGATDRAMVKLANLYALTAAYDRAEQLYEKAFAQNPQNEEALYRLCAVNIDQGQYDKASAILSHNENHKMSGWYHLVLARLEEAKGNTDAAAISYTVALRLSPDNSQAYMGLGRLALLGKRFSEAMEYFGKASAGEPNNPDVLMGMAKASIGLKDAATALDLLRDVVKRQPDNPDVYYLMGLIYSKQQEHVRALETLRTGLKKNPQSSKLTLALGHEYRVSGQYQQAIDQYQKVLKMGDKDDMLDAYQHLGDIYFTGLKDMKNAEKYYAKYVEAGGDSPTVKKKLALMQK